MEYREIFLIFTVPRQCPLFPVNIVWKEGNDLGNEDHV
jgi:hypothetical protein